MARDIGGRREFYPLFCVLAALVFLGVRMVLRFDFIDQATGFYNTDSTVSILFNILYFLFLGILIFLVYPDPRGREAVLPLGRACGFSAGLLGAATLFQAVWEGGAAHAGAGRAADVVLRWATLAFALVSGAVLLVLAAELWRGGKLRSAASGALAIPVLHRCFLLVNAFTRHTTSMAVSEDMLEILLLTFGVLFFVAHARVLSGFQPGDSRLPGEGFQPGSGRLPGEGFQPGSGRQPGESRQPGSGLRLLLFSGCAYIATWAAFLLPGVLGALTGRIPFSPLMAGQAVQASATALYCFLVLCRQAGKNRPTAPEPCTRRTE